MSGLVSVVTPTYNAANYLEEAIESAILQTYANLELIVVDDGSTDCTKEKIEKYNDLSNFKYIYQDNDGTRGNGARARAMLESKGEWIALLDHDDRWLPTKIEEQLAAMADDPGVGIVFTGTRVIDSDGKPTGQVFPRGPSGQVFHELLQGNRFIASSAMIRRSALDHVRAIEGDFLAHPTYRNNDYDLWLRLAKYYRVAYIDNVLTEYRYHSSNDSLDRFRLMSTDLEILKDKRNYLHENCPNCERSFRRGISYHKKQLSLALFDRFVLASRSGDVVASFNHLADAIRTDSAALLHWRRLKVTFKYSLNNIFNRFLLKSDGNRRGSSALRRS